MLGPSILVGISEATAPGGWGMAAKPRPAPKGSLLCYALLLPKEVPQFLCCVGVSFPQHLSLKEPACRRESYVGADARLILEREIT